MMTTTENVVATVIACVLAVWWLWKHPTAA